MKVIIAGSRKITDEITVFKILDNLNFEVTEVLCGMAEGVDLLGKKWAESHNINVSEYPANWKRDGFLTAGFIRNQEMADNGECLVLIWDGQSSGSRDMMKRAKSKKLMIDLYDLSIQRLF